MAYRVLIPQDITDMGKMYLRERGYEVIIGSGADVQTIAMEAASCDAILARTAAYPREIFENAPNLKVIGRHGVGVENIDLKAAKEFGVVVTYAPYSNANSVAEHTLMLILECARKVYAISRVFREQGDFSVRNSLRGMDLEGKMLGVIGLGRIGRKVAHKAIAGFDMKVLGFDPWVDKETVMDEIEMLDSIEALLELSDFVSLNLPLTEQTRHSFGIDQFRQMKKTAYLINVARGEIIVEEELVQALKEGIIAGAGLDVFSKEPVDEENPLLRMENVIATPHNAGLTQEAMERSGLHAAMGIDEVLSGKKPTWPVKLPD
jgi:D-3-phosphoglycerate dehydrogenase